MGEGGYLCWYFLLETSFSDCEPCEPVLTACSDRFGSLTVPCPFLFKSQYKENVQFPCHDVLEIRNMNVAFHVSQA